MRKRLQEKLPYVFIGLTFASTWSLLGPAALSKYGIGAATVSNGARTLAGFTPTIVAIVLIAAARGRQGLLGIWRAIFTWRIPLWPTATAFVLPQLTCLIALNLFRILGGATPALGDWSSSVAFTLVLLPLTAFFEEVGWRYLLLEELQKRMSPLFATAMLALIWGLWHLPMYLQNHSAGERTGVLFILFMIGVFPVTAFASWFYNRASGRLLPVMLFHASLDASIGFYFGKLPTGELRPFGYWVCIMWMCSLLLYWWFGKTLGRMSLAQGEASSSLVPPGN